MSFLTLAIVGMLFQSFTVLNNEITSLRTVEYDEEIKTAYSFEDCDVSKVSRTDLLQSREKIKNNHFKAELLRNNEVRLTTTILDKPKSEHDIKNLVGKVIKTNGGLEMYDFNGKKINVYDDSKRGEELTMNFPSENIKQFGVFPIPKKPTKEEIVQFSKEGKVYKEINANEFSISSNEGEVIVNTDRLSVEIKPQGDLIPFKSQKTLYSPIDENYSVKAIQLTQTADIMSSGQKRTVLTIKTFKNYRITENGLEVSLNGTKR